MSKREGWWWNFLLWHKISTGTSKKAIVMRILLFSVRIIPKFRDSANWSRDTVQPMRRHAFVYQNVDQVLKNFHSGRRSQTEHCHFVFLLTDANCTCLGFTNYFKENIWCKRIGVLFISRNCWSVWIFQSDRRGRGFSGMACKILIEVNWSHVKTSLVSCCQHPWTSHIWCFLCLLLYLQS